jgi:hypothetical protein
MGRSVNPFSREPPGVHGEKGFTVDNVDKKVWTAVNPFERGGEPPGELPREPGERDCDLVLLPTEPLEPPDFKLD